MEKTLAQLGLQPVNWSHASQCCGTFLTVARPDIVTPKVNSIMQGAAESGADCIVTACAMCHMNLEVRCALKNPVPIFHFSEILSLAFGPSHHKDWFSRHLIDPRPLLKRKGLTAF
jgi:heterodisulfide reductase subunit B